MAVSLYNKQGRHRSSCLSSVDEKNGKTYPFKHDEEGVRKKKKKIRKLTFASHIDAAIFAYYAEKLQADYEKYIKGIGIDDVVTAYRKIKSESHKGNKCNIDFAYDVFSYIKRI